MQRQGHQLLNKHQSQQCEGECEKPFIEEETCWKTNLFLQSEVQRVNERGQIFHKRTSFQQTLLNNHITQMLKVVIATGLNVITNSHPKTDKLYASCCQNKEIEAINANHYLTEQQKWEMKEVIFMSQQNFSILMRLSSVFNQNKNQLVYILCKILKFCTVDLHIKQKYNSKKETLLELMDKTKIKLMDSILSQETVKVVNPLFFSNVNETPLMRIIDAWFYHTICIKQGLYGDDLKFNVEAQQTYFEQENYLQND